MPSVLFVLTSAGKMTNGEPTGWYLPELAHPYHVLSKVANVVVVSPKGGEAPISPDSIEPWASDEIASKFYKNSGSIWKETKPISEFIGKAKDFDAIFFVGGHGPMFDLTDDAESLALVKEFAEANKVVSAVCHGPAGLLNVKLENGKYLIDGEEVTGFSNDEETENGSHTKVPYVLEGELKKRGAKYSKAANWAPHVVVSKGGKLITGQNPASSTPIAEAILKAISA